ncbi:YrhA family protein [Listeria seeligeri]|uniref:YrhA family protein n=1 Tax=Listeria seeligeri TaxID=1640 RepID=UPI001E478091|nr:YrhA family protein [Listeria seeligeri]
MEDYISKIRTIEHEFGNEIPNPISEMEYGNILEWLKENFGFERFDDYYHFLLQVNGLSFNGLYLYGFQPEHPNIDLIDSNKVWREHSWTKQFLFLGDDEVSFYVWNTEEESFQVLDKPGGDVMEEYENLTDMFEAALKVAIP